MVGFGGVDGCRAEFEFAPVSSTVSASFCGVTGGGILLTPTPLVAEDEAGGLSFFSSTSVLCTL
jgi:hypothetical protein